jgi:hypothetical protein
MSIVDCGQWNAILTSHQPILRLAMKKLCLIACGFCALLSGLSTDAAAQGKIALGLRAGVNIANVSLDPGLDGGNTKSARMGFLFGGIFEYAINNMIALQAQPAYCQRGYKLESTEFIPTLTGTIKLDYIEVPVLVKLTFGSTEFKPYVFAGPNIAMLLSAKSKVEMGGQSQENDFKDNVKSTDLGLDVGAGVSYWLKADMGLYLDARYSLGLTNLSKDSSEGTAKSGDIKICAGLLFRLK